MMRSCLILTLSFLLVACGGQDADSAQGGVGADDAKRLDAAAARLDAEMQPVETPLPAAQPVQPGAQQTGPAAKTATGQSPAQKSSVQK